ncbi:MAG: HAD family hydrolase [Synergistaceae bacterium]|nr:HAD family hydrolase [Synergistaceae bacterium]
MKVKWCVSDIDGTIMNTKKELDDRIIEAIRQYENSGGTFILATGRTMLTAREIVERIGLSSPVISGNGSVIQYASGETLLCHKIPKEASASAAEYAIAEGFDFVAFSSEAVWYPHNSLRIEYFKKRNEERGKPKIPLVQFSKAGELPHGEIIKFFIWNMNEKLVRDFESNCNDKKNMNFVQSVRGTLDVDPAQATKGSGIKFLATRLDMDLENTAAIGDNKNDLDMLQAVGFPVAVANAEDELKEAAWKICPSNDECGVAVILEEFMKG